MLQFILLNIKSVYVLYTIVRELLLIYFVLLYCNIWLFVGFDIFTFDNDSSVFDWFNTDILFYIQKNNVKYFIFYLLR